MIEDRMKHVESEHGGIDWNELQQHGIDPQSVTDLSSNILFVEPSDLVREAIAKAAFSRYPDLDCGQLRKSLAQRHSIDHNQILVGNGCSELIHLVARTFLQPADDVLVVGPTFSEYRRASELSKANVHEISSLAEDRFTVSLENIETELCRTSYRMIWLCNPNNPTAQSINITHLRRIILTNPQTTFVVDESYIEFADSTESMIEIQSPNLIVLRSMTKAYALAGLRLGYLVTASSQLNSLIANRVPWSVNEIAQAAGVAALQSQPHYDDAMKCMKRQRLRLIDEIEQRGYQPLPSDAGFLLIPVNNVGQFRDQLLSYGLLIRDCRTFGLENFIRIAVGDDEANSRLSAALDSIPHDQYSER